MTHRAVIFDLGGVVFPSPFEAFDEYDHGNGLVEGTVRGLIRRSSEEGAWAALERGELGMDEFAVALEAEADAAGFRLDTRRADGADRLVARAAARDGTRHRAHPCAGLRTAALTNNWTDNDAALQPPPAPRRARVRRGRRVVA